jgi:hypothetical protein
MRGRWSTGGGAGSEEAGTGDLPTMWTAAEQACVEEEAKKTEDRIGSGSVL